MKLLKLFIFCVILCLLCSITYGQNYIPFASGRFTDTAKTPGSLLIPFYVRIPFLGTGDTDKVVGVLPNGLLTLRTKNNTGTSYTAGYGLLLNVHTFLVDTSVIVTKGHLNDTLNQYALKPYIPQDSSSTVEIHSGSYEFVSSLNKFKSGKLILINYDGSSHTANRSAIVKRRCTDGQGITWSAKDTIYYDGNNILTPTSAIVKNNRILLAFSKQQNSSLADSGIFTMYSDDEGITWSTPIQVPIPSHVLHMEVYGKPILIGGDTIQISWYKAEGTDTSYGTFTNRGWNNGATWSEMSHEVITPDSLDLGNYSEASHVYCDNNTIVCLMRDDKYGKMKQAKSITNGRTWTDMGYTTIDSIGALTPCLKKFRHPSGREMLVCYTRVIPRIIAVYGFANDIIASATGWDKTSRKAVSGNNTGSGAQSNFYPDVIQDENSPEGIGVTGVDSATLLGSYQKIFYTPKFVPIISSPGISILVDGNLAAPLAFMSPAINVNWGGAILRTGSTVNSFGQNTNQVKSSWWGFIGYKGTGAIPNYDTDICAIFPFGHNTGNYLYIGNPNGVRLKAPKYISLTVARSVLNSGTNYAERIICDTTVTILNELQQGVLTDSLLLINAGNVVEKFTPLATILSNYLLITDTTNKWVKTVSGTPPISSTGGQNPIISIDTSVWHGMYYYDTRYAPISITGTVTSVTGTSPISSSGGNTPAISIANAAADGSTKGAASFAVNDFDASAGNVTIDYVNGQAASASVNGFVNTGTQSFAGNKTYTGNVTVTGTLTAASANLTVNTNGIGWGAAPSASATLTIRKDRSGETDLVIDNRSTNGGAASGFLLTNDGGIANYMQFYNLGSNFTTSGLWTASAGVFDYGGTSNMIITNNGAAKAIIFAIGGHAAGNEIFRINSSGCAITGTVSASSGIVGVTTNSDAATGIVGEYASATVASGSAVSLSSGSATTITSISLTAGDWDVTGVINYSTSAASSSDFKSGSNTTTNTFGGENTYVNIPLIATGLSDVFSELIPVKRYSLASTTTVYLVGQATFSLGAITGYGLIQARRMR